MLLANRFSPRFTNSTEEVAGPPSLSPSTPTPVECPGCKHVEGASDRPVMSARRGRLIGHTPVQYLLDCSSSMCLRKRLGL